MARTVKAARIASNKHMANGNARIPALADALEFNLGVARTMLNSSLAAVQGCLHCVEQVQQAHAETIKDLSNVVAAAVDEAEYSTSLSEFLDVYRALTAGQFMRAAHNYGTLCARLARVEAGLIQQAHAAVTTRSTALLDSIASQIRMRQETAPTA